MTVEQIYTGCLAQGAYYIASEGEAVVIDPLRESAPYLERADRDGVRIKYVLETHFHADFVSGHVALAEKSGATIPRATYSATKTEKTRPCSLVILCFWATSDVRIWLKRQRT
jgi:glyoxylase-like metal-dependent hydrolase (beta-lactamase superfamily II)